MKRKMQLLNEILIISNQINNSPNINTNIIVSWDGNSNDAITTVNINIKNKENTLIHTLIIGDNIENDFIVLGEKVSLLKAILNQK